MSGFKIIKTGIIPLIKDNGRFGFAKIGICNSGANDEYAYNIINLLLGNDKNSNVLELSFSGLVLEALEKTTIAIAGADFSFSINEKALKPWQTYKVLKGDILKFSKKLFGEKAYLGVKGGFILKKELGSCSTSLKEGFGTILKKDMILAFKKDKFISTKRLKKEFHPNYEEILKLRVVLSYQENSFDEKNKNIFFNTTFTLSNESNSMGAKIDGAKIKSKLEGIISEGISFGAIQVPKDGRPIVLLKQRQTIGGYPKIGSVLSIDCFKLAQSKAGTKIIFEKIEQKEAITKLRKFYQSF